MKLQPAASDALLTPAEVAKILFVDPKTVTRWARAGKLDAIRTPGGHRRYQRSDVMAIMAGRHHSQQQQEEPTGAPRLASPRTGEEEQGHDPDAATSEAQALALETEAEEAAEAVLASAAALTAAAQRAASAASRARAARAAVAAEAARQGAIQVPAQRDRNELPRSD